MQRGCVFVLIINISLLFLKSLCSTVFVLNYNEYSRNTERISEYIFNRHLHICKTDSSDSNNSFMQIFRKIIFISGTHSGERTKSVNFYKNHIIYFQQRRVVCTLQTLFFFNNVFKSLYRIHKTICQLCIYL